MAKPNPEQADRAKKGIRARQDALATLIANHQEEFDELVVKNRLALGLSRRPQGPTEEQRREQIKRAEEQIARWRGELGEAT